MRGPAPSGRLRRGGASHRELGPAVLASIPATLVWGLVAVAILWALPERAWRFKGDAFVVLGVVGIWRYGWLLTNAIRSWVYATRVFPRLRRAERAIADRDPRRLYFLVPSFQEDPVVSRSVFAGLVRALAPLRCETKVFVSVGSPEEAARIREAVEASPGHERLSLVFLQQSHGKRIAMGHTLRAIARDRNDLPAGEGDPASDVVVLMDGDTLLRPDSLERTLGFFRLFPALGALTTDEEAVVADEKPSIQEWYRLRFARRHSMMKSHALSGRVMTLTGRFSVYRAALVLEEAFIRRVESDHLDHWTSGRFRFLMGDDKSTWFHLLSDRRPMLYVPDVLVHPLETRTGGFVATTLPLMRRWYGNMLRTNGRALRLGPAITGAFPWWVLLDQRLSMWTTLIGPVSMLLLAGLVSPFHIPFYVVWVIVTRLAQLWVLVLQGLELRVLHLPLQVYDQWVGAVAKIHAWFHPSVQSWAKGKRRNDGNAPSVVRHGASGFAMATVVAAFVLAVGLGSGALRSPSLLVVASWWLATTEAVARPSDEIPTVVAAAHGVVADDGRDDAAPLGELLRSLPAGRPVVVRLPEGTLDFDRPLRIERAGVTLRGAGPDRTRIATSRGRAGAGEAEGLIVVAGARSSRLGRLAEPAEAGRRVLLLEPAAGAPPAPESNAPSTLWIGAPNDAALFAELGEPAWRRSQPWLRQVVVSAHDVEADQVVLESPLRLGLPAGATIRRVEAVEDVWIEGLTIRHDVPEADPAAVRFRYENLFPEHALDSIRFEWARGGGVRDVAIEMSGRHPLVLESSLDVTLERLRVSGAWNKGPGGNGYVRFSRTHDSRLLECRLEGIRHLAIQWSSSGNRVERCTLAVDVNFHGGLSHHNVVEQVHFEVPERHPWENVTTTPRDARWAPPDGPGNEVRPR